MNIRRGLGALGVGAIVVACSDSGSSTGSASAVTAPPSYRVMLLHTNDLHSHLEGHEPELDYTPLTPNDDSTQGGFARIAAKIAADRTAAASAGESVIVADAGDFMMGTGFSSFLGVTQGTELYELSMLGYDAIALGNHEFDFTSDGLAGAINAATTRGAALKLLATNMTVPTTAAALKAVVDGGLIPTKRVETLPNGLKVGFVGIMGKNASDVAPLAAPVTFDVPVDTNGVVAASIQSTVDDLRNNDKVDVVIALSHSGTDDQGAGEDQVLASKAHGIDIIVSGHTHVALTTPVAVPNADGKTTYIVQTGAFGLKLGKMDFTFTPGAGVTVGSYELETIDDTITGDATVQGRIDGYVNDINQVFASAGSPFTYLGPIATTAFDLPNTSFAETGLGDLVTDAYLAAANSVAGAPPTAIAIEDSGNIRVPLLKGKTGQLAFADVFNVVPLGIGPDHQPGYPLTAVYLTAKDIVNGLTLSSAAADPASAAFGLHDDDYFLQMAGVTYHYDLTRGTSPFEHVTHIEIGGSVVYDTTTMPSPDDTKCYRVVATYYLASLFGLLETATGGALSATPKQADCATAYTSATLPTAILDAGGGAEIHQWQAVVKYIAAAKSVPASYATPAGRIIAAP